VKSGSIVRAFLRPPVVCDHARPARPLRNLRKLRFPMELAWGESKRTGWRSRGSVCTPTASRQEPGRQSAAEDRGGGSAGFKPDPDIKETQLFDTLNTATGRRRRAALRTDHGERRDRLGPHVLEEGAARRHGSDRSCSAGPPCARAPLAGSKQAPEDET
jgi:hypothetical protein